MPYYAVSTEPAELLTCGEKCSQEKIISAGIYMQKVQAASYILQIYIAYMNTFSAADYVSADSYLAISMELNVLFCTIYLTHYTSDMKGTLKR